MHGGQDGDGFSGDVHAGEDHGRLRDAGQASLEHLWRQVVQLQEHVVLVGSHTSVEGKMTLLVSDRDDMKKELTMIPQ